MRTVQTATKKGHHLLDTQLASVNQTRLKAGLSEGPLTMATLKTDAKENQIMQIFKEPAFTTLLLQVQKLKTPIAQEGELYMEIISFFKYVSLSIGVIRHNTTGRKYILKSKESDEFFGTEMTQLLYQIVNKCCYQMSSKLTITYLKKND